MTMTAPKPAPTATDRTRTRTALANDSWEALLTAHATLMRRFAMQPVWEEISMREYDVLYSLAKGDHSKRLGELGRIVLLSQPALSRLVDRLIARGLVSRVPDPADARATLISLTTAGRELQQTVGRAHGVAVARSMAKALSNHELELLEDLTTRLAEEAL